MIETDERLTCPHTNEGVTYVTRNKAVIGLEKDNHGAVYRDNLCLFRCLALHLGREAAALVVIYARFNHLQMSHVKR